MCVWIIHTANLPAHFPSSRKSLRLNCLSRKLAFCLTKNLLSAPFLSFPICCMNIKNCTADDTVKAGEAPFHIKPGQKEDARGSPPPKKKNFNVPCPTLCLYPISKSCVRETRCGTTDKRDSPCLTTVPLSFFIFPVSLLFWSSLLCPFSSSRGHWIPSPFFCFWVPSPHFQLLPLSLSLSLSLPPSPIFHNYLYFLFPLSRQLPPLISLPVSFPHVYLALSLSLVVSSLGKLKRCEEGNKSKSKNAFRGWRQAQTSVCLSEDS